MDTGKHIQFKATVIFLSLLIISCISTSAAQAFETPRDTETCRAELAEFHHEAAITNMLLLNADQGTHPISGFLRHDDVFDKSIFLRAYAAEGSNAFYELPRNATGNDCKRLEDNLSNGIGWLAQNVIDRDPDRCRKYDVC